MTYTYEQRETYETEPTIAAGTAAHVANEAWTFINNLAKETGNVKMPNDDKAEELVMAIFNAVMEAQNG